MKRTLLLVLLSILSAAGCMKPPAEIPTGKWEYDLLINGTKVGSAVTSMEKEEDTWRSELTMEMSMGPIRNTTSQTVVERTDFTPVSYEMKSVIASGNDTQTIHTRATFNGREVTIDADGRKTTVTIDRAFYLEGNYLSTVLMSAGFKTGTRVESWLYDPTLEMEEPVQCVIQVEGTDTIDVRGRSVKVYVLRMEILNHKNILYYMNQDGVIEKISISMLNNHLELVRKS